ncbi:ElaA protein [Prauserella shujinwangii]|uniref:ElaA protein n=1 Tax=Prauserella shujinwangii TaxID=1453103 RepID=A0A2T0LWP0_9PSEU|nr:GNAT family N-acetyltransferase [Prauserella shujinwangii]PRX48434.1 ElaA protein [Prauserella shujinwangii]
MTDIHSCAADELTAAQLYAVLRLRVDVFVVEQECPYPELDGRDLLPGTRHFWFADGGDPEEVTGYLRVLREPGGALRIGRVCTATSVRGSGLGARLMTAAMEYAGEVPCVLEAQTYAQGFYARFGFVPEGEEYLEDGIPHITMWRR